MKYEEAMKRLEQIVSDIENNKLDIDLISDKIKGAQELIKFCKDKLYKTDEEIQKLLED
jgi:exodeoxyribonuclease VII small subunit